MNERDRLQREMEAYSSLSKLLDDAQRTRDLFVAAKLDIPAPLLRLTGENGKERPPAVVATIPTMELPPKPAAAGDDWVFVPMDGAYPMTLVKALLRNSGGAMKPRELVDAIQSLRPELGSGGVYNTGPRLEKAGIIEKSDHGWVLVEEDTGPILTNEGVWGHPKELQKQEVAAHRRALLVHVLSLYKSGLQVVQIVEQLKGCIQCKAPVTKDLVKADMLALQEEKRVKRAGNSKKWVLTNQEDE